MRVLQINAAYGHGSTGLIVRDIEELCSINGIDCYVASPDDRVKTSKRGYVIGGLVDRKLHALLCRISGKQGYFSHIPTIKLCAYINVIQPDVIHLHNLHNNYINLHILLRFIAKRNIKTIVTLHDCWFFTGGCTHYTSSNCYRWLDDCGDCPRRYLDFPSYLKDSSSQQLHDRRRLFKEIPQLTVVGASRWIANESLKSVFNGRKSYAIYNGVDTEFFKPTRSHILEDIGVKSKYVIVSLATKWYLPINEGTRKLLLKKIGNDVTIVLIGKSEKAVCETDNRIHNLGFISSREFLRDLFSAADLFLNLTREDTLPTVNMEVQSCGTPIVAYDNTGVKETIAPFTNSVVENGNACELVKTVLSFMQKSKELYTEECRVFVLEHFQRAQNYAKYVDLYKKIAENNDY